MLVGHLAPGTSVPFGSVDYSVRIGVIVVCSQIGLFVGTNRATVRRMVNSGGSGISVIALASRGAFVGINVFV